MNKFIVSVIIKKPKMNPKKKFNLKQTPIKRDLLRLVFQFLIPHIDRDVHIRVLAMRIFHVPRLMIEPIFNGQQP